MVESLEKVSKINKKTMREFDKSCLIEIKLMSLKKIMKLRKRECLGLNVGITINTLTVTNGINF